MSSSSRSTLKEQNINVFVRIRPFIAQEKAYPSLIDAQSETEIYVKHSNSNKRFKFDRVFNSSCTQKDIYNAIVKPLIPEVIAGYNCTILAYGQTDTGKTYTMTGERGEAEGIIPRALTHIFDELSASNTQSSVRVSYIELYNEELFDLLAHTEKPIRIYEDKNQKGSVILQGIDEYLVTSKKQVYKILEKGSDKRKTASTLMNAHSSRSHIVFTIIVHSRETTSDGEELVKSGKMNLVDLAGCENILRSGAIDKRAREAGNINQSLLTLGRVINALTDRNTHIPYRESKLTRLLQDSLGGRTKTYLIATISSSSLNLEETLSTLDYAMRARNIQNRPEVNQKISRAVLIKQYLDEIERLKKDLAASRTGNGVFLDEDNYKSLMSSTEAQRSELLDKVTTIKTLQSQLDEQSDCVSTIQKSLTNSMGVIESLKHEQEMLTKEKDQLGKELDVFKDKTIYLEGKTMKLYHNQETLHSKLTYLYQISDANKSTTKKFNDLYAKLNNELISRVDQCISFVLRSATDTSQNIQCNTTMLEECYNALKTHLSDLTELSSKISNSKHTYFPENKDQEYLNKLENITDNIHKQTFQFLTTLHDECLERLKEVLNRISNMNLDELITSLSNIRRAAVDASYFISTSLADFHDVLMCNIESIISNIEAFNSHNITTESAVSSVIEDMTQEFMKIEDQIKSMREKYLEKLSVAQQEQKHAIQHGSNLLSRMVNFREIIRDRIRTVSNGVVSELDKIKSSITEPVSLIEILKSKGNEEGVLALQLLQQHSNDAKESKKYLTKYFYTSKSHFSDYRKQILEEQRRQTAYYKCIDDHCDNLNSIARNAFLKLSSLYTSEIGNGKCIDQCMRKTKSEVTIAQEFYQGKSKSILEQVKKFCEAELNYPARGEDPPRISLPNISQVTGSSKSTKSTKSTDREPSFSSSETGLGTTSSSESIIQNYSYDCPDVLNGENSDSSFHDLKS